VATASVDRTARVWCADTGALLSTVEADEEGVMAVALTGCGPEALLLTGGLDGHVRVWDCHTGAGVVAWRAHGDWIRSLAVSARGDRVVTAGRDGHVRAWSWPRDDIVDGRRHRGHTARTAATVDQDIDSEVTSTSEAPRSSGPGTGTSAFGHWSRAREFDDVCVVGDPAEVEVEAAMEDEDGSRPRP
jgi:WD40 repeat protein